eukprot:3310509-Rhodomonas_salina.2
MPGTDKAQAAIGLRACLVLMPAYDAVSLRTDESYAATSALGGSSTLELVVGAKVSYYPPTRLLRDVRRYCNTGRRGAERVDSTELA